MDLAALPTSWLLIPPAALLAGLLIGWSLRRPLLAKLAARLREQEITAARLEAKRDAARAQLQEREQWQGRMRTEFTALSAQMLEESRTRLTHQNQEKIGALLTPLKERLEGFEKQVRDSHQAQAKDQHALKEEIKRIVEVSRGMTHSTENLAKALRGDVKTQGNWGEITLERLLESSGLLKDVDYTLQGAGLGLSDADGRRLKPDVVVHLPEGKHLLIDAKVSLTDYERLANLKDATEEEPARKLALQGMLASFRAHVTGLAARHYAMAEKIHSPDFVLLFVPIEGACALAMQQDTELHAYAWERRVVIAGPSTLFSTLRTVASLWRIERQHRHAEEIAREGGLLYDKLALLVESMQAIGTHIEKTRAAYDDAMNRLSTGRGNLLTRAEKMRKLGAKTSKQISLVTEEMEEAA